MIEIITDPDSPLNSDWDKFIIEHSWPGHALSGWHKILDGIYKRNVVRFISRKDGVINGICFAYYAQEEKFLYTSRFGIFSKDDAIYQDLLKALKDFCEKHRITNALFTTGTVQLKNVEHEYRSKTNMFIQLDFKSEEVLWLSLPKKTKNMVRKAEKGDLNLHQGWDNLAGFYDVYQSRFLEKGLAIKPLAYFQEIQNKFEGKSDLFTLTKDGRVVAGMIFLQSGKTVTYLYNASEDEATRDGGNNLLMWEAMKRYHANGALEIELGESTPDGPVYNFKKRLSKNIDEKEIYYIDLSFSKAASPNIFNRVVARILRSIYNVLPFSYKIKYLQALDKKGRLI